jgi:hypothetical protein
VSIAPVLFKPLLYLTLSAIKQGHSFRALELSGEKNGLGRGPKRAFSVVQNAECASQLFGAVILLQPAYS